MATVETATNGRTADGKFSTGNRAAAGHKRRQHVAKLRAAFTSCLTEGDIVDVVTVLLRLAKDGDVIACRLLLDRALGRVATPTEFEGLDDALDTERDLQDTRRRVLEAEPNISPDMLERKVEFIMRMESATPEAREFVIAKLKERKAARAAEAKNEVAS